MNESDNDSHDELSVEIKKRNQEIKDENDRYDQAIPETFKHKKILKAVRAGIADDQIDSFQALLEAAKAVDYDKLAQNQSGSGADDESALDESLAREVEEGIVLAPRKAEIIMGLADKIHQDEIESARDKREKRESQINREFEQFGEAWEIPKAISPDDRMILFEMVNEDQSGNDLVIEDIIPLTPEERESQVEFVERLNRQIKAPNATNIIISYLKENVDKTISREEFARLLYVADLEQKDVDHVTSRLGPKIKGPIINSGLEEDGLVLQYGFRYAKTLDGKLVRRTRIYRAVEPTSSLADTTEDAEILPGHVIQDEFEALSSLATNTDSIPVIDEKMAGQLETLEAREHKLGDELIADTNEAIDQLISYGLFDEDELKGSGLRSVGIMGNIARKEEREKLRGAGIMSSGEVNRDTINREQRVMSLVFKKHPELYSRDNGQKYAVRIIHGVIQQRMADLQK